MKIYISDPVLSTVAKLGYLKVPAERLKEIMEERSTDPRSAILKEKFAAIDKNTMSDGMVVLTAKGNNDFEIGDLTRKK